MDYKEKFQVDDLANFTAQSFMRNKALCGPSQLQEPPCHSKSHRSSKTKSRILRFGLPAVGSLLLVLAVIEYGLNGLATKIDVYSFGIMLMEIITRKKPTDEMFEGEMSLKRLVKESLPGSVAIC
ncbi:hypothetical protein H0E87_027350 [Populus deltoides]|uniref:Serine-threonine/tyrosine-protein kinase catalytic domain-containing protein n=1 Tax=Populus deltoides TaxID=3696 RepID=A0A8T2X1K7_POPDE|nr:hypothetical protein H0E87_027350 [Populus deltoides]